MKEIELPNERTTLVDDKNFNSLNQYSWFSKKHRNTFYVLRKIIIDGKVELRKMHHDVIGKPPKGKVTDHKNGNGLDNQEENLKHVTNRENCQNKHIQRTSKYPGVYWNKERNKWQSNIKINGKTKYLGRYDNEIEASKAYENKCKELLEEG